MSANYYLIEFQEENIINIKSSIGIMQIDIHTCFRELGICCIINLTCFQYFPLSLANFIILDKVASTLCVYYINHSLNV
jgi:hypothetical protein